MRQTLRLTFVIPSLEAGGAEKVMALLANAMAEREHAVTVLTWDDGGQKPFHALAPNVRHRPLNIRGDSKNAAEALSANVGRIRAVRSALKESDPHVILSFIDTTNVVVLMATIGLGIPVVVGERMDPRDFPRKAVWRWLRAMTYPWASHIVVQTQAGKEFFADSLQKKISVIPNPVPPPSVSRSNQLNKKILAIGRLSLDKGFDLLLQAFAVLRKTHPDWTLSIVGEGSERKRFEKLRDDLNLGTAVEFLGQVHGAQNHLAAAAIFVMPSRTEGIPNALLEAMAMGLPVIASDCNGCKAVVENDVNGLLFPSENAKALSERLIRLVENTAERERLAKRASEIVDRLDPPVIWDAWEKVFSDVKKGGTI